MKKELNLCSQTLKVIKIAWEHKFLSSLFPVNQKEVRGVYVFRGEGEVRSDGGEVKKVISYGVSVKSKSLAQIKCVGELMERICLRLHKLSDKELIGSGAAAGFNSAQVISNGLYELIERDAFMTGFMNGIHPPRLLNVQYSASFRRIVDTLRQIGYSLEIFDITNDLGIPTFTACIIELSQKTNQKRTLTVGIKSNMSKLIAIEGAIEESLLDLILKTNKFIDIGTKKLINPKPLITYKTFCNLYFSDNNEIITYKKEIKKKCNLKDIYKTLREKNIFFTHLNITPSCYNKIKYQIGKISSLQLQPLFFDLTNSSLNIKRIKAVKKHFAKKLKCI